jgi:hypothetical protein
MIGPCKIGGVGVATKCARPCQKVSRTRTTRSLTATRTTRDDGDREPCGTRLASADVEAEMLSNWYKVEVEKAISGYRAAIADLEGILQNTKRCDQVELWWKQTETRIEHLKQSIASLESTLGNLF